jgi:hypothetical protein
MYPPINPQSRKLLQRNYGYQFKAWNRYFLGSGINGQPRQPTSDVRWGHLKMAMDLAITLAEAKHVTGSSHVLNSAFDLESSKPGTDFGWIVDVYPLCSVLVHHLVSGARL